MVNGLGHAVPHGSLCRLSDVMISEGCRNNPWGTFFDFRLKSKSFLFLSLACVCDFTALNCLWLWVFFLYVCWWCYYWSDWGLGGDLLCVVDVLAGGQGGSEDRTSLRGVAVNPWPRWLSLQGGGGLGGGGWGGTPRSVWFRGTWW